LSYVKKTQKVSKTGNYFRKGGEERIDFDGPIRNIYSHFLVTKESMYYIYIYIVCYKLYIICISR